MQKKGQIQLTFGMVFTVIVIAVTLAVAGYVIMNFLTFKDCSQTLSFYDELQKQVDQAYESEGTQKTAEFILPSAVTKVCLGSFDQTLEGQDSKIRDELKNRFAAGQNVFLYPELTKCSIKYRSYKLEHIKTNTFFCINAKAGKFSIQISKKDLFEPLVTLSK
jgi:hypothetical protein